MKKSIIAASAASLALAAMPVVSTFAVNHGNTTVTDKINLTIDNTCSLSRSASTTGHGLVSSTWANDTTGTEPDIQPVLNSGTYTAHMDAGTNGIMGKSTFTVACNDVKNGHSVNVTTTSLIDDAEQGTQKGTAIAYTNSDVNPGTGNAQASGWNITIGNASGFTSGVVFDGILQAASGSAIVYSVDNNATNNRYTTAVSGATFEATYKVGASITQDSGTYEGQAVYTLVNGPAS